MKKFRVLQRIPTFELDVQIMTPLKWFQKGARVNSLLLVFLIFSAPFWCSLGRVFGTLFFKIAPRRHGHGQRLRPEINFFFLESKNSKLEFSTPKNFWIGNLQVAPRRHGGGQGSRREIIFVFLKLKNSKLEFSTSENFGTEICGSHPGGMGMGQGRGGKLMFFFGIRKIRN